MKIVAVDYPPPTQPFSPRSKSDITDFVCHHSGGPKDQTPLEIDAYLRSTGDIYIAYTWLIADDGTIFAGRPPLVESAATLGRNPISVAVCVIGNFQTDDAGYNGPPSTAALSSLYSLCVYAHQNFPIIQSYTHGDVASLFYGGNTKYATACCGNELRNDFHDITKRVYAALIGK